nr:hypothetical protein [Azohydromonas australica]
MAYIASKKLFYYCPLKDNRYVDDSKEGRPYQRVDSLQWTDLELHQGKIVKVKGFPPEHRVKLFRVPVSTHRINWIVTNDLSRDSTDATQEACGMRWKIEQFHREFKQLTGAEKCQCRRGRMQRNHIACAVLVWDCLAAQARPVGKTLYQLKREMLSNYLSKSRAAQPGGADGARCVSPIDVGGVSLKGELNNVAGSIHNSLDGIDEIYSYGSGHTSSGFDVIISQWVNSRESDFVGLSTDLGMHREYVPIVLKDYAGIYFYISSGDKITTVAVEDTFGIQSVQINTVSEPGSLALLSEGLFGAALLRRRSKSGEETKAVG